MHSTARRCCYWAVALFAVGIFALALGPRLSYAISVGVGANAEIGMSLLNLAITVLMNACLPTAGALVGAAVVINTLTSRDGNDQSTLGNTKRSG